MASKALAGETLRTRAGTRLVMRLYPPEIRAWINRHWKGGRFAHQRPHSIMDNADNAAVGYLNNAPVSHLAFILLSVGCSVSVAGSDIGPKVLDIMVGR